MSFQNSLSVVQYITDNGIAFTPKVIPTKKGQLYSSFKEGTVAVFEYVQGELYEPCSIEQLYELLVKIYMLKTDGIELKAEQFDVEVFSTFQNLQNSPELPNDVLKALDRNGLVISKYGERLNQFSFVCKNHLENFHITHGDAGGNCILNSNRLFLVDWDSVTLAPVERDAWIYICDKQQLEKINTILAKNGIGYNLEQNRLCYYCYYFFFYYLNEYLKSIVSTEDEEQKTEISMNLIKYLTDSWLYKQLAVADRIYLA